MKKILLLNALMLCLAAAKAQTSFTEGNLVVYRYGAVGGSAPSSNQQVATFLDEYKTDGTFVRSIALPTVTNGDQRALTGIGTSTQEGTLSRSVNGAYLTVLGFEVAVGTTTTSSLPRVVGRISLSGEVNTATAIPNSTVSTPRSAATVDGSAFWMAGTGSSAIRYFPFEFNKGLAAANSNSTFSPGTIVGDAGTGNFYTYIFNNQLYYSTTNTIRSMGTGLPQISTAVNTILPGFTEGNRPNPFQFIMFDTNSDIAPDLMYMANENTTNFGSIVKYVFENGKWINKGSLMVAGKTENMRFMTASVSGGVAAIYCTSIGNAPTSTPSAMYKISNGIDEDLTNTTPLELLALAPANTSFRGVAFAPGSTTTPVKLTSFRAGLLNVGEVQLRWLTLSENNNSHFEVLRSADGKEFSVIGSIRGKGQTNNQESYSFTDLTPLPGINYYQLRQVDYDGKSEKFEVIAVNSNLEISAFKAAFVSVDNIEFTVPHTKLKFVTLYLTNTSGQLLYTAKIQLPAGVNKQVIKVGDLAAGIYVLTIQADKKTHSIKLMK